MSRVHAHKLVLETARAMAASLFEDLAKDNARWAEFQATWPEGLTRAKAERMWVEGMAPKLLGEARDTLARLLNTNLAPDLKDQIADALILDNTLRRGRADFHRKLV